MHDFDAILHVDIINWFIYYIYISYIGSNIKWHGYGGMVHK